MRAIGRDPIFIARGEGAEIVDVDGNRYVDYVCSWGPLIHGHAHPEIVEAVVEAAHRGTTYGAPTAGEVELAGSPVRGVRHNVGFLFQDDALLPWRTVEANIALGLRLRKVARSEVRKRTAEWIHQVGLDGFAHSYPAALSGGMRKRASIAQTLICDPSVILMDEPFAHLDAQARYLMQMDLLELCADGKRTILFVTHDLDEAIGMADTVVVLSAGPNSRICALERVGIPRPRDLLEVRRHPRFGELSSVLWRRLHDEVRGSYGRTGAPPGDDQGSP